MSRSARPSAPAILPLLSLALLAGGCHPVEPSDTRKDPVPIELEREPFRRMCTMELRILMARLEDAAGRPVEGATVAVNDPHGRTRMVEQGISLPGMHTVFTDGLLNLDPDGTEITARFSKDGRIHDEVYRLATDGCHFQVLSAPDTVRTGW